MTEVDVGLLVYVDANVFIDFLQGDSAQVARLEVVFDKLRAVPGAAVTSELTFAESWVRKRP